VLVVQCAVDALTLHVYGWCAHAAAVARDAGVAKFDEGAAQRAFGAIERSWALRFDPADRSPSPMRT